MISTGKFRRVFAYARPVDMRKGFDGLYTLAREGLRQKGWKLEILLFSKRKLMRLIQKF